MTYYREKTGTTSKTTFDKFVEAFDTEFGLKPIGAYVELAKSQSA